MEYDPAPFYAWFIRTFGNGLLDELIEKSHKIAKFSNSDLQEMLDKLA